MATCESLDSVLDTSLADSSVGSRQDSLVVAVHACLLSTGYILVAIGDKNFQVESSKPTEILSNCSQPGLPVGWNNSQDTYELQYRHEATQELCLIKALLMGETLLVNAMAACDLKEVCTLSLDMSTYLIDKSERSFNSSSAFKNLLQLMSVLSKDLVGKLSQVCTKQTMIVSAAPSASSRLPNVSVATTPRIEEGLGADPLRIGPPRQPGLANPHRDLDPLLPGPFGYGDPDRNPLGIGGPGAGGMIFDPLRQGGRNRGVMPGFGPHGPYPPSHPQGARYDPVHPFGPGSRPYPPGRTPSRGFGDPDPDHLPPPGYDDMFS